MSPNKNRYQGTNAGRDRARTISLTATIFLMAMILGIVAWAWPGLQTGEAYSGTLDNSAAWKAYGGSDPQSAQFHQGELGLGNLSGNPVSALWPSTAADPEYQITQSPAVDGSAGHVYTWAARLTVGQTSNAESTFLGYVAGEAVPGNRGKLTPTTFTYRDVDYTVQRLFLWERKASGAQYLVFGADASLPDNLILHIGDQQFPVSESRVFGYWSNIYAWSVDADLGWRAGHSVYVALLEPTAEPHETYADASVGIG